MKWTEIGDGVYARRYEFFDQQIGAVLSAGEVALIDTRSTPVQAREILADLRELTHMPVSVVINTHWHWDHTFGNSVVGGDQIWGHVKAADRLRLDGAAKARQIRKVMPEIAGDLDDLEIKPPNRTFEDRVTLELGSRTLELAYHGRAHTDGDITIRVPGTDVLFAGDLIEESGPPNFGDAYPFEWPETLARVLGEASSVLVPGHGAVVDRLFVESQLGDHRAFIELVRAVASGSLDRKAAIAMSPFGPDESAHALDRALSDATAPS